MAVPPFFVQQHSSSFAKTNKLFRLLNCTVIVFLVPLRYTETTKNKEVSDMNINIGAKIKANRLAASMTQEQLANRLGVSAQAVSKWESGSNMPDIQMLPELSVIFGVSIDSLFDMTDESKLERIDNMLDDVRFLSEEDFRSTEQYLKDCTAKPTLAGEATLLLAALYNKRADEYHELAAPIARKALELMPDSKTAHNAIFNAENGPYQDWNFVNHHCLIDFYKQVVKARPKNVRNYFWLLDLLMADGRTSEARQYAEEMKRVENSYHYEMYMGNICKAECDLPGALDWWKKMTEHSPEKWVVWSEYADCMAKLCRYEEAIAFYQKAMPMRPKPRFTDCEEAVAHIYEIQGNYSAAIEMNRQRLQVILEDWTFEGETVDAVHREIRRLEERMK